MYSCRLIDGQRTSKPNKQLDAVYNSHNIGLNLKKPTPSMIQKSAHFNDVCLKRADDGQYEILSASGIPHPPRLRALLCPQKILLQSCQSQRMRRYSTLMCNALSIGVPASTARIVGNPEVGETAEPHRATRRGNLGGMSGPHGALWNVS